MNNIDLFDDNIEEVFLESSSVEEMFSIKSLGKKAITVFSTAIKYIEARNMFCYIRDALGYELTPSEFREWFNQYSHKTHFIEFIEKQRRANHALISVISGGVSNEAYLTNRRLSTVEMNHIECLLTMNLNDIHNCIHIYNTLNSKNALNIKAGKKKTNTVTLDECKYMECIEITRSKLNQYGYLKVGQLSYLAGNIPVNDMFYDLLKYIEPVYKLYTTYNKDYVD